MLGVRMEYGLLKALKRYAIDNDTTVNNVIVELAKKKVNYN